MTLKINLLLLITALFLVSNPVFAATGINTLDTDFSQCAYDGDEAKEDADDKDKKKKKKKDSEEEPECE